MDVYGAINRKENRERLSGCNSEKARIKGIGLTRKVCDGTKVTYVMIFVKFEDYVQVNWNVY